MTDKGPGDILKLSRNFMESRILLSAAELNLFTMLGRGPLNAGALADTIGADLRGLTILLDALAALGLLDKDGRLYRCPESVLRFLSEDSPDSVLPMLRHAAHLWGRWSGLTGMVKDPCSVEDQRESSWNEEELSAFVKAMDVIARPTAPAIVAAVAPASARRLLDIGGALGTYTLAFLEAAPAMKATLFDRPRVIEMARDHIGKAGFLDRVSLVSGDFYEDELPGGHDLGFLSAIIHQNSPEENVALFKKTYRALGEGGRIVIRDHVMESARSRPRDGALFAVNMLVVTSGGGDLYV